MHVFIEWPGDRVEACVRHFTDLGLLLAQVHSVTRPSGGVYDDIRNLIFERSLT